MLKLTNRPAITQPSIHLTMITVPTANFLESSCHLHHVQGNTLVLKSSSIRNSKP